LTDQPIQPRGLQPKDLKNTLGRRPTAAITSLHPSTEAVLAANQPQPGPTTEPAPAPELAAVPGPGAVREPQPEPVRPRRRPHTVFYLPLDLSKELRELARSRNKTNADVIFDALESTLEELPQLLKPPAGGGEASEANHGMFTRTPTKPVGQKVQISGRIQEDNLAIIDQLVDQHGAESRSQLVEVALRAYLSDHTPVPAR
jgi:hypothetical protein